MANVFTDKLDDIVSDAAVASAAVGTIASGSDVVVSNFAGLQDLVDELSAFATLMKSNTFYAPVGLVAPFGGVSGSVPGGWLLCAGQPVSQSVYADLYAVVGANAFGTDGGGNFYLPDLRGRTVAGIDNMNGTDAGRLSWTNGPGYVGPSSKTTDAGEQAHVLTPAETAIRNHYHNLQWEAQGGGVGEQPSVATGYTGLAASSGYGVGRQIQMSDSVGGGRIAAYVGATAEANGAVHNNMQPTMTLNYIIKV